MVRTKQSVSYKISIGKVPKLAACKAAMAGSCRGSSSSSSPSTSKNKYSGGGNPVHPREIPVWQKEITCFFQVKNNELPRLPSANEENEDEDDVVVELPQETMQAGSSKM